MICQAKTQTKDAGLKNHTVSSKIHAGVMTLRHIGSPMCSSCILRTDHVHVVRSGSIQDKSLHHSFKYLRGDPAKTGLVL